ncbi:MAG: hypothetical protein ACT4P6_02085 [Gemmatimonadaceae bacterium]
MSNKQMRIRRVFFSVVPLVAACGVSTIPAAGDLLGVWGGTHIALDVAPNETAVELDCAHGTIHVPLTLDASGRFDVLGEFVRERGGPVRESEPLDKFPVRYRGVVDGNRMQLTIERVDSAQTLGSFSLRQGDHGTVFKCL